MPTGQLGPYNGLTWNWDDYDATTNPRGLGKGGFREETGLKLLFASHDADLGVGFQMSATDSLAISTGTKTFNPAVMRGVPVGNYILALFDASNWMWGQITAKTLTALTVNVIQVMGSGTKTAWTLQPTGPQAPPTADYTYAGRKTANYNIIDGEVILADTSAGGFNVNNPTLASGGGALVAYASKFKIIKRGGGVLTIPYVSIKLNGLASDATIPATKVGTLEARYIDATEGFALEFSPTSTI